VDEEQWNGTLDGTPLVYVMNAQFAEAVYRDGASEHGERIQLAFVRAPIVPVLPPANEPLDICEWHAVGPLSCFHLVWQAGIVELALEQSESVI
jgi:hypothetical protein